MYGLSGCCVNLLTSGGGEGGTDFFVVLRGAPVSSPAVFVGTGTEGRTGAAGEDTGAPRRTGAAVASGCACGTFSAFGYVPTTTIFRSRAAIAFDTVAQITAATMRVSPSRTCFFQFMTRMRRTGAVQRFSRCRM